MPAEASDILKRLYETGEYSDLKVVTSTQTFSVHKNVVCTASPFFAAACRNDWQEARTGTIHLVEDAETVETIIRWCYGMMPDIEGCLCDTCDECIPHHLPAVVAADKYQLPALKDALIREIESYIGYLGTKAGIEVGHWMYEEERRHVLGPKLMRAIVEAIGCSMRSVMADLELWQKLEKCPELLKDVLRRVAQESSLVDDGELLGAEVPEYLQLPKK